MSQAVEGSKALRAGVGREGIGQLLVCLLAAICVAAIYAAGVVLSMFGHVVQLDLIVFVFLAVVVLSIAAFGRMSEADTKITTGFWSRPMLLVVLICLFLILILETFRLKESNGYFMFGFVPWSDAEAYVPGGWQMLVDGTLSEWHQRRPINASMMEVRLLLSGFNLYALVLLNSLMVALATLYALLELEKHIGALAAAFFVVVVFGYAQPYLATTLSEVLGLTLGIVAFGALLRSARLGSVWLFTIGLAILSFALNARAGNYFVLPAIWLWAVVYLGRNWRERAIVGGVGAVALLSGFVYSLLLIKVFGNGDTLTYNANFGDTIYGLAKGGIGWHRAQEDHPELYVGVDAAQRAAALFKISLHEIALHPLRFIGVYFHDMGDAVPAMLEGPKLHLIDGYQRPTVLADLFGVINLIGLAGLLRYASDRRNALILLVLIGFFVSIPFIWHDGGPRVLAASIAFVLFVVALGVRMIGLFFQGSGWSAIRECLAPARTRPTLNDFRFLLVPSATWIVLVLTPFVLGGRLSALGAKLPDKPVVSSSPRCPAGTEYFKFDRHRLMYSVRVHPGDGHIYFPLNEMTFGELQATLSPFHISPLLQNLPAPYTIFGIMGGGRNSRALLTVVWKGETKRFTTGDRWDLCVGEFPHEFTGYKGHVYVVESEL
jgi:hypothetical protein